VRSHILTNNNYKYILVFSMRRLLMCDPVCFPGLNAALGSVCVIMKPVAEQLHTVHSIEPGVPLKAGEELGGKEQSATDHFVVGGRR